MNKDSSKIINLEIKDRWKVLVIDKDEDSHREIENGTRNLKFEERKILYYNAYDLEQAESILKAVSDIALVFIDTNISGKESGIDFVRYIREDMGLANIKIILMSEDDDFDFREDLVLEYEINGYDKKTQFFYRKIKALIINNLRGYRDIKKIKDSKNTMNNVVASITNLHKIKNLETFLRDSKCYLSRAINNCSQPPHKNCKMNSFIAAKCKNIENLCIISATGKYKDNIEERLDKSLSIRNRLRLEELSMNGDHKLYEDVYMAKLKSNTGRQAIILIERLHTNSYVDLEMLNIFYKSIVDNFDNLCLNLEMEETQYEILNTLAQVTEARSEETGLHIKRVSKYSTILAEKYGLSQDQVKLVEKASPIHDIGKISIPDEILNKKGRLTAEEFNIVKTHTTIGYNLLKNSEGDILKTAAIIANEHHERYDGRGYPRGLKGEDIHIYGRITAIADVFDALGSDRIYKKAWVMNDILNLFRQERGKHFDPELVDILFENLDEFLAIKEKYEEEYQLEKISL